MGTVSLYPIEDLANTVKAMLKLFGRTEESFREDVKTVEQWMRTQPHLPEILDEDQIANFLTLNKCSVERTKLKIDNYYTLRSFIPELYEDVNPELPHMKRSMEIAYWAPLPKLTGDMYRVFVLKIRDKNRMSEMEPREMFAHFYNMTEIRLKEDRMLGDVVIIDLDGVPMSFLLKITPTIMAKCVTIYEKVYSFSLKVMYLVNGGSVVKILLQVLKLVLKPKLFQRVQVCEDVSILRERVSPDLLPTDFGGNGTSCEEIQEVIKLKFAEYKERFDKLDKMRVDENLRPQKLENDEILGFHGNFKKLTVD